MNDPSSDNLLAVMNQAMNLRKAHGDGRLGALIDRSIAHVTKEFPGQMKQAPKSKTVKAQMDKLIWQHGEARIRRFLKNHNIALKLA